MSYVHSGNWSWEFDPPPYDFLAPRDSAPQPAPILRGFGAAPETRIVLPAVRPAVTGVARANQVRPSYLAPLLDRMAGGSSRFNPTPTMPRTGGWSGSRIATNGVPSGLSGCGCGCGGSCQHGLGLFESGLDFSGWGIPEWGIMAVGGYLVISLVGDLLSAGRGVKKYGQRVAKRRAIRAKFKRELAAA